MKVILQSIFIVALVLLGPNASRIVLNNTLDLLGCTHHFLNPFLCFQQAILQDALQNVAELFSDVLAYALYLCLPASINLGVHLQKRPNRILQKVKLYLARLVTWSAHSFEILNRPKPSFALQVRTIFEVLTGLQSHAEVARRVPAVWVKTKSS